MAYPTIPVGGTPTGVAVDAAGKVWVTNYDSDNAMRIDPATNSVDLTVFLGSNAQPYNYSDMTGSVVLSSPPQGKWILIHDSGQADTTWDTVAWTESVPPDTSITVRARSANSRVELANHAWTSIGNGTPITNMASGRYLHIEVLFTGTEAGATPVLYDLTVNPDCEWMPTPTPTATFTPTATPSPTRTPSFTPTPPNFPVWLPLIQR